MKQFFAPISKINKKTREVHGILALEVRDKEGEIMDYADSKPLFEKWSKGIHLASGGKSVGNLRVMHQPIVGGKFTQIEFDDENKRIPVVAKVSNDEAWKQVLNGELNGFSIYGNPTYRKRDKVHKAIRYAVEPLEGSLVDNPCMYGADFTLIKEDGNEIVAKFAGNKEPEQFWSCKKDCDLLHKNKDEASGCSGTVSKSFEDDDELEEDFTNDPSPVSKGMYDVSSLASNIASLKWLDVGSEENAKKFKGAVSKLFSVLAGMVKVEKSKFEETLDSLVTEANTIKAVGSQLIRGEEMKVKVKKSAVADTDDEMELDIDEIIPQIEKRVAKTVGKAAGVAIKEHIEELVEDLREDISELNKAVVKMANLPRRSKTVVKGGEERVSKRKKDGNDEDEEETLKPIKKTANREDLTSIMKTALKNPLRYGATTEEELEEDDEENSDEENEQ